MRTKLIAAGVLFALGAVAFTLARRTRPAAEVRTTLVEVAGMVQQLGIT